MMELEISYLNTVLIFIILATSLNLLLGYAGQVSIAHAAFAAIGGYSTALLFLRFDISLPLALLVSFVMSALVGLIVGIPALRLSTEFLILLTLAVQTIIVALASSIDSLGGAYGLQNVHGFTLFGQSMTQPSALLPLFAVLTVIAYAVLHRLGGSAFGRVLRGIREDELVCRSLGKNVFAYKLGVFSLTAGMAGVAGTLLVVQNQIASPNLFGFDQSTVILAMVILGGSGNLLGSALGATILVLLTPLFENLLSFDAEKAALWRLVAYGLVLLIVVLVRPQGLLPEGLWRRKKHGAGPLGGDSLAMEQSSDDGDRADLEQSGLQLVAASDRAELDPLPALLTVDRDPAAGGGLQGDIALEVTGLSKSFGGIVAASDLRMSLKRGTITAVVGPNGAGKTTLFNLLTGSIRPDAGCVELNGRDVTGLRPDQVARLGMTRSYQDVRVFPRMSVLANVMLGIGSQPGESAWSLFAHPRRVRTVENETRDRALHWLSFVGMAEFADSQAGSLAFGQQKLVALARVLATESEVVLLDEPASGIDEQWVDVMLDLIEQVREQGRTVCVVEHNLHVVGRLSDHTYFMELGRITAEGSFRELTADKRLAEAYFGTK